MNASAGQSRGRRGEGPSAERGAVNASPASHLPLRELPDGSPERRFRTLFEEAKSAFDELLKALKSSIETVAQEYAWKEGDSVRIVFHIFKPIKHIEADVVAQLVESFPQFRIIFSFVTISTEHPWMMFRDVSERNGRASVSLCERGDNLILDPHHCLLHIRGDRDRPNKKQRPPYPVLIRVHEKSTYKDLKFIAQQITTGQYGNASEVIREALRYWREERERRAMEEFQAAWPQSGPRGGWAW